MNISSEYNVARSVQDMGNLLKNMANASIGLEEKMLKVAVTEKVQETNLGQKFDALA